MAHTIFRLTMKIKTSYSVIAALCCVALWAFKPILVKMIGGSLAFAETYLISSALAIVASLIIIPFFKESTKKLFTVGIKSLTYAIVNASIAGVCLALWYYGFYRSLTLSSSSADATVISFSWPLIAVIAMMIFSKEKSKRLNILQWSLMALSFVGVALISLNSATGGLNGSNNTEILWAVAASIGSGLYLPFSVNASRSIRELTNTSSIYSTFVSISMTNIVSLLAVSTALFAFSQDLNFENISLNSFLLCLLIGLGIYVVAEIAWTWVIQSSKSLTIASLPYFSPAISVILLLVLFHEPVTIFTWIGLSLILASNFALQRS